MILAAAVSLREWNKTVHEVVSSCGGTVSQPSSRSCAGALVCIHNLRCASCRQVATCCGATMTPPSSCACTDAAVYIQNLRLCQLPPARIVGDKSCTTVTTMHTSIEVDFEKIRRWRLPGDVDTTDCYESRKRALDVPRYQSHTIQR